MEFKSLLDITNAIIIAWTESMESIGVSAELMWTQMIEVLDKNARDLIHDAGLDIDGKNVQEIVNNFTTKIKEIGMCNRVNLIEVSEEKIVVDIGECVFAPATQMFYKDYPDEIPPCPVLAILASDLDSSLKKRFNIVSSEYKPELHTHIFELKHEEG